MNLILRSLTLENFYNRRLFPKSKFLKGRSQKSDKATQEKVFILIDYSG
jgi:hypothetical protein